MLGSTRQAGTIWDRCRPVDWIQHHSAGGFAVAEEGFEAPKLEIPSGYVKIAIENDHE